MYKKFNTIVKIVNIIISFYIKTSNENSKKSDFFLFLILHNTKHHNINKFHKESIDIIK